MAKPKRRGERFKLLVYGRMAQRWALPCVLIVLASCVLWWFAPRIPILHPPYRPLTLVPGAAAILLLLYTALAGQRAWVQSRSNHLRIQTPFYPLAVSYARIKSVRPRSFAEIFASAHIQGARADWVRPFGQLTALVVELSGYPLSKPWLRLWFSPYLFYPKATAFVLLVDDWMALSRQLDEFRSLYQMRRAERRDTTS
jgi:hypothetical protein